MKKKIILAVVIVVAVVIVGFASIPIVNAVNDLSGNKLFNNVMVGMATPVSKETEYFMYTPMFGGTGKSINRAKLTDDEIEKIFLIQDDITEFRNSLYEGNYAPYYLEAIYENKDGKTVITYRGEITNPQTGEKEPYEKIFEYDFFLTKNIGNQDISEMKYFN